MNLLPCPFCGEDGGKDAPRIQDKPTRVHTWYLVRCFRCSVTTGEYLKPELAAEQWNMRSKPKSETFGANWWDHRRP